MALPRPAAGVALMGVATLGFAGMATMVKLMDTALPETELVFWRAVFALPVLWLLARRARHALVVSRRPLLLLRSVMGFGAMLLFFYAIGRMTLAEASILVKLQPVWVALLAPAIVGDRPGPRVWICLACSLAGVGLVLGPHVGGGVVSVAGIAALGSSLLSAVAHLLVRRLGRTEHPDVIVLDFTFLLMVFAGLAALPVAEMPAPGHWPILVALGLFAMTGQLFMTSAYQIAEAPTVATVGYLSIPVASVLDWALWGHVPTATTAGGGLLIIAAGVALAYHRPRSTVAVETP